jgi:hypothetical protein
MLSIFPDLNWSLSSLYLVNFSPPPPLIYHKFELPCLSTNIYHYD